MTDHNTIKARNLIVDHRTGAGIVRALVSPSIYIEGGSSLAIMGASGCGKSTLLGLLGGLALPTSGTVKIGDLTISELPERQRVVFRRKTLGMVYQADNLLPHLTVEENVGLQLAICRNGRDSQDLPVEDPAAILRQLGLGSLAKRLPDQLSGGQRQRVAVARAIVHRPAVILADEPTGSLDSNSATIVIELLINLHQAIGATLVIVTHDPKVASYLNRTVHLPTPTLTSEPAHAR